MYPNEIQKSTPQQVTTSSGGHDAKSGSVKIWNTMSWRLCGILSMTIKNRIFHLQIRYRQSNWYLPIFPFLFCQIFVRQWHLKGQYFIETCYVDFLWCCLCKRAENHLVILHLSWSGLGGDMNVACMSQHVGCYWMYRSCALETWTHFQCYGTSGSCALGDIFDAKGCRNVGVVYTWTHVRCYLNHTGHLGCRWLLPWTTLNAKTAWPKHHQNHSKST